jgi:hypothetical protein
MRVLDLVAEDRRYFELHMDGSFSYAAGVITYRLAHANLPRKDDYLRDFVVRREGRCVWMVDPFNDKLQCQKRAGTMDLPPPPEGYSLGTNPDYSPGDER